jgi:hypothetical protein
MSAAHSVADLNAILKKRAFSAGLNSPAPSHVFNMLDSAARFS